MSSTSGVLARVRAIGRAPGRAARSVLSTASRRPLLRAELRLDVGGAERAAIDTPLVIVANHASRVDLSVLLAALPEQTRKRTVLGSSGSHLLLGSSPDAGAAVVAAGAVAGSVLNVLTRPAQVLRAGGNVVIFPEGGRSADGYPQAFGTDAARLAISEGVPVLPVAIRGSFAAMPRGQVRPSPGRPRVTVRFGSATSAAPGEPAEVFTERIAGAVQRLIAEDVTTWWQSQCDPDAVEQPTPPPPGSWRRIWEQLEAPTSGGRPPRLKIWR